MGTKPDEIVERIDRQRDRLGENLQELETRFRDATDWRVQYSRHPWAMLGIAFGGGLLVGAWLGTSSGNGAGEESQGRSKPANRQLAEAIRGALITLAVNKLKDYLTARIPSQA